jgi:phosphatidate phosphatase APP1
VVFGHVFNLSPLSRKKYRKNVWTNALALVRSFMVDPVPNVTVVMEWRGKKMEAKTASDGFFMFQFEPGEELAGGLHTVEVHYHKPGRSSGGHVASGKGYVVVPHENQFAVISDIDDTFLVSHSSSVFKKLYVLLTKNAHTRKPFEGVVKHYKLLASANAVEDNANAFFYVSSSEWNLYSFIKEFCRKNEIPEGVYLLSQIKKLKEAYKTGGNKHATKFTRIARIMEAYPDKKFVLFGDDSQMDPTIYAAVVDYFPGRVISVYLRHVYEKNISNVKELISKIEAKGVHCCHFKHSNEAITHSYKIGLITEKELELKKQLDEQKPVLQN